MTEKDRSHAWSSPLAHALDDLIDENTNTLEIDDINILYLAQRIVEIAYLQKQLRQNLEIRKVIENMLSSDSPKSESLDMNIDFNYVPGDTVALVHPISVTLPGDNEVLLPVGTEVEITNCYLDEATQLMNYHVQLQADEFPILSIDDQNILICKLDEIDFHDCDFKSTEQCSNRRGWNIANNKDSGILEITER